jgi:hypothetical protein
MSGSPHDGRAAPLVIFTDGGSDWGIGVMRCGFSRSVDGGRATLDVNPGSDDVFLCVRLERVRDHFRKSGRAGWGTHREDRQPGDGRASDGLSRREQLIDGASDCVFDQPTALGGQWDSRVPKRRACG